MSLELLQTSRNKDLYRGISKTEPENNPASSVSDKMMGKPERIACGLSWGNEMKRHHREKRGDSKDRERGGPGVAGRPFYPDASPCPIWRPVMT